MIVGDARLIYVALLLLIRRGNPRAHPISGRDHLLDAEHHRISVTCGRASTVQLGREADPGETLPEVSWTGRQDPKS